MLKRKLEKIVLSSRLKEIPEGAFDFCPKLVEVILPKSVRKIGDFAFRNTVCKFSKEKLSDADEIVIDSLKSSISHDKRRHAA